MNLFQQLAVHYKIMVLVPQAKEKRGGAGSWNRRPTTLAVPFLFYIPPGRPLNFRMTRESGAFGSAKCETMLCLTSPQGNDFRFTYAYDIIGECKERGTQLVPSYARLTDEGVSLILVLVLPSVKPIFSNYLPLL